MRSIRPLPQSAPGRPFSAATLTTAGGRTLKVHAETVCVHSDTPNAVEVAAAVRDALAEPDHS